MYVVQLGKSEFAGTVHLGNQITDELGQVTLEPGNYEIRVAAKEISGEELMRLRKLFLKPREPLSQKD